MSVIDCESLLSEASKDTSESLIPSETLFLAFLTFFFFFLPVLEMPSVEMEPTSAPMMSDLDSSLAFSYSSSYITLEFYLDL